MAVSRNKPSNNLPARVAAFLAPRTHGDERLSVGLGGNLYSCSLQVKDGIPTFDLHEPVRATVPLRQQYGVPDSNGTVMEIIVSREDVKVPQFDNFRNYFQRHFELRPIMSNPKRKILLREIGSDGKLRQEHILSYRSPKGKKVLSEKVKVEGYPVSAKLEVYRSNCGQPPLALFHIIYKTITPNT